MSLLFSPITFDAPSGPLTLANRIVVAPMCQYACDSAEGQAGQATDWHLAHWTQLLNSGAAMLTLEATAVSPEGRISPFDLGLWNDTTAAALGDKLARARRLAPASAVCVQLAHAGRKASSDAPWRGGALLSPAEGGWQPVAPSALPHAPHEPAPEALSLADLTRIKNDFVAAAKRSKEIGLDAIELHGAHGYLLHQFMSPLANQRSDTYGGSFENRARFPLEVFKAVREAFDGTLGIRISGTDWVEGGWTIEESCELSKHFKAAGAQFIHVSSGGVSPLQKIPLAPGYQVPLAHAVREASGLLTFAVGLITEPQQAENVLIRGEADVVALARAFLYKPRWGWEAAAALGGKVQAQPQYWRCLPREAAAIFEGMRLGGR